MHSTTIAAVLAVIIFAASVQATPQPVYPGATPDPDCTDNLDADGGELW